METKTFDCDGCEDTGKVEVLYSSRGEPAYRFESCEDCRTGRHREDDRAEYLADLAESRCA